VAGLAPWHGSARSEGMAELGHWRGAAAACAERRGALRLVRFF
jgi:hypothetical protein